MFQGVSRRGKRAYEVRHFVPPHDLVGELFEGERDRGDEVEFRFPRAVVRLLFR